MKSFNGRTIVRLEKRINNIVEIGGKSFILDSMFRQYWNTVHMAEVVVADRNDISPGDIVVVHHFVNAPEQILPTVDDMSYLEFNQIYAKIKDDKIMTLNNYVLVKPVTYGEAGLVTKKGGLLLSTHSEHDEVEKIGIAAHLGSEAIDAGLKEGDKILFNRNCEYEMLIKNELYYRMELRDVITTIDDFKDLKI